MRQRALPAACLLAAVCGAYEVDGFSSGRLDGQAAATGAMSESNPADSDLCGLFADR